MSPFNSGNLITPWIIYVLSFLYLFFGIACSLISGHFIDPLKRNLSSPLLATVPCWQMLDCRFVVLLYQPISLHWLYISFRLLLYQISPNSKFIILCSGGPKSNTCLTGLTSRCQEGSFLSGSSRRESVSLLSLEAACICWLITPPATSKPAELHLSPSPSHLYPSLPLPLVSFFLLSQERFFTFGGLCD